MRERLGKTRERGENPWITPAYAGKTGSLYSPVSLPQDHPRVCGKDHFLNNIFDVFLGSPPRMRERRAVKNLFVCNSGITPAYAGKTRLKARKAKGIWDHPRVCGKDTRLINPFVHDRGSPPRMRERQIFTNSRLIVRGITPAYAGKTLIWRWRSRSAWDHPRVCGKDSKGSLTSRIKPGSPPRMRERPLSANKAAKPVRITPAYAGKTSSFVFPNII